LRAYYGVGAALSLGTDRYDVLDIRGQTIPGAARFFSAGRGITMPEPGRTTVPYWVTTEAESRKAVEELAAHKVDVVKIWVDITNARRISAVVLRGAAVDRANRFAERRPNRANMMSTQTKSFYDRLGGHDAITAVANDLLPRLQADPQLGRFWAHRGADE
jgi:hypothetical protein